jgi:Leucine-rich repeat (LRR) protein
MLHGQIPHAFTNLTSLAHLDLFQNYFDSVSTMLIGNGLKKLVYLDIGYNEFYGPIPEVFRNMTSIESLYLYYNNFTSVPSWFCNFEKLTHLDLSFNGLHGPIPDAFRNMLSIDWGNLKS